MQTITKGAGKIGELWTNSIKVNTHQGNYALDIINKTGGEIAKGTLLYISGYDATSGRWTIAKADADAMLAASFIATGVIAINGQARVEKALTLTGLNTSGYSAVGDPVYLDYTTAGGYRSAAPTGADQLVQIVGMVTVKHASTGIIKFGLDVLNRLNGKVIGVSALQDLSVTNAKMATDCKIGSLAALVTTEKASVVGAINECKSAIGAGTVSTMTGFTVLKVAKHIQLNGHGTTPINFIAADAATLNGGAGPFVIAHAATIKLTVDEEAEATATFSATAGTHVSQAGAAVDLSAGTDRKFNIANDGDATEHEVVLTAASCTDGNATAAEMQTQIQALGGIYAGVTVTYGATQYTITSQGFGTGSNVIITNATTNNCADDLKIGTVNGGTSTPGTGDCVSTLAVTRGEVATWLNGAIATITASGAGSVLTVTSKTTGKNSRILCGNGSANATVGLTNLTVDNGAQGMGAIAGFSDANYAVLLTLNNTADPSSKVVTANNRSATGFDILSDGASDADYVDILCIGA